MKQAAFLIEEDDFHRLEFLGKLPSGNVSIDVEDLTSLGLGQAGEDGQSTSADGLFQRTFINSTDLSHKAVLFLVQVVCGKNTGGDRSSTRSKFLEGGNELQVLLEEDTSSDVQGSCVYAGCQSAQR